MSLSSFSLFLSLCFKSRHSIMLRRGISHYSSLNYLLGERRTLGRNVELRCQNHLTLMNICKVKSNKTWGERARERERNKGRHNVELLYPVIFGTANAQKKESRAITSALSLVVFINPCLSVSRVELMRSMCSKFGLTWLFLGKRKPLCLNCS